jgi:hypothetical protein
MKKIIPVKNYENEYMVSDDGQIFRITGYGLRVLKPCFDKDGYLLVSLSKNGISETKRVHRLVAEAFIKNKNPLLTVVNHIDENKQNNDVSNLEWCTVQQNTVHRNAHYRRMKHRRKPIIAIRDGEVLKFDSIKQASEVLNISHGNIISCLKGTRKTAGGMTFEYINHVSKVG